MGGYWSELFSFPDPPDSEDPSPTLALTSISTPDPAPAVSTVFNHTSSSVSSPESYRRWRQFNILPYPPSPLPIYHPNLLGAIQLMCQSDRSR